jgi:3-deoxy-D-manno-octulosonic-acid transferase
MNLKLYKFASKILGPAIDGYLLYRKRKGKEDSERFDERIGKASIARPEGKLVWVHAASIGEAISVIPLIKRIQAENEYLNFLFTTGTVTSSKILQNKLPKNIIHQYVPVDRYHAVRRFLDHWRPNLAIWVESELWPNLVTETREDGCPIVLVNGRMSSDSYEKWKKYNNFVQNILSQFSLCAVQTEDDATKFKEHGAKNVIVAGNLKYEAPALPADPGETGKLINMIGDRQIWLAASTNKGEEEYISFVHEKISEKHDKLLTIIAPRHPERSAEISSALSAKGLNVALRSKGDEITSETNVYLADTVGEMGIFYRLCGIVFMGGSLIERGGQNPLEAARLECAILSGMNTQNFQEIYSELEKNSAVMTVKDAADLGTKIDLLLSDHDRQEALANAALKFIESKAGIIDRYMELLLPYLKPMEVPAKSS